MSSKRQDPLSQISAEGGCFMMIAGEDTSSTSGLQAHIANGVQFIHVVDSATISALEEKDAAGNVVNVIDDGTGVILGQRVSAIQLPAGTFMKAVTAGGFTKIALSGTPSTGKIVCVRKTPETN